MESRNHAEFALTALAATGGRAMRCCDYGERVTYADGRVTGS